jgi:hypothetical protein
MSALHAAGRWRFGMLRGKARDIRDIAKDRLAHEEELHVR